MKKINNHIIVGYGKWGQIIFDEIKNLNFFNNIYIKSNSKNYLYKNQQLHIKKNIKLDSKYNSAHICVPVDAHYSVIKKLTNTNKIILEKPSFKKLENYESDRIKKINFITNYSDLYSPGIKHLKNSSKMLDKTNVLIRYRNKTLKYFKNFECLNDWLDHPLSLVIYLFGEIDKFSIIKFNRIKYKKFICEILKIKFEKKNISIVIDLNTFSDQKKVRSISIKNPKYHIDYNFYNTKLKIMKNNSIIKNTKFKFNSIENIYNEFFIKNKKMIKNEILFSKKIFKLKSDILKKLQKIK